MTQNQRLGERNSVLEECDMDSAGIEISRAAETIR